MEGLLKFTSLLWVLTTFVFGPLFFFFYHLIFDDSLGTSVDSISEFSLIGFVFGVLLSIPALLLLLIISLVLEKFKAIRPIIQKIFISGLTLVFIVLTFYWFDISIFWEFGFIYLFAAILSSIVLIHYKKEYFHSLTS